MSTFKELYRFADGSNIWTVTSADSQETYNGESYEPIAIGRSEAESKSELSRANIEIKMALTNEVGLRWLREYMSVLVGLTIYEKDPDGDVSVVWKGRLAGVKPTMTELVFNFESIFTSLRRPGVRARYQRTCRHALYSRGCNLNKSDFAVFGIPTAVSGLVVTVPEAALYPDGWFSTGIIEMMNGEMRFIANHVGSQLSLIQPFISLARALAEDGYGMSYGMHYGGASVVLYPGCNRSRSMCSDKFSNLPNYGGFDWIPLRNPFDGSSIV